MKISQSVIAAFILFFASIGFVHAEQDRILGSWEMAYDPDGDTKDILTFQKGGAFSTTEVSSGKKLDGFFVVSGNVVKVSILHKGMIAAKMELQYDDKSDSLNYKSDQTKNVSTYKRIKK